MLKIIDVIYVLKLKKNDPSELEQNVKKFFPETKIQYFNVNGISIDKNEGKIDLSLWNIIKHNTVDTIAKDITQNHIKIIQEAYNNNYDTILILEEDARIVDTKNINMENINKWLSNNEWDIFYFGYCNWPILCSFFITSNIVKISSPLLTHAYMLSKRGMEKILNYTENGNKNMNQHIDKLYLNISNAQKYGIFPMIAFQNKNAALFTKALDKININLSMNTACKISQYISIIIPIVLIILLVFSLFKIFFF